MTDMDIEQKIQAAGLTAPRLTPDSIESVIAAEYYFTAEQGALANLHVNARQPRHASLGCLTFCVLLLKNGFTVTGESACASPANFNEQIGREIARKNAVEKIWPLEGYLLKQALSEGGAR